MLRKFFYPHSLIVTCLMFVLIWVLDIIRINLHFLNPFNETIRDYEITDIVYSRLRDPNIVPDNRIVLVHWSPPSRDTLRMMVDRIVDSGAKVVALDITLEERKNPQTDSLLRNSLTRIENTVLANVIDNLDENGEVFRAQVGCDTFFGDYVYTGFINFIDQDSSTIRYFSPREKIAGDVDCLSFAAQIAKLYDPEAAERLFKRNNEVEEIYFAGNEDQFVHMGKEEILDTTQDLRSRLSGKIVIIGFLPLDAWDKPGLDRHYTPLNTRYTGRNTPDMYGIVIHANIIRMILDNHYVNEISLGVNLLLTFIFCYFNIHLFYQVFRRVSLPYQFITRFMQLGEIILLFFVVALLFYHYRIKMDVAYWITALLLTFDAIKFYDNGIRKRIPLLSRIPYELPPAPKPVKRTEKPIEKPGETPEKESPEQPISKG